ncbi:hypothetical protein DPM35_09100 [Mesorhizobium atlanticum]|uniref:Uncharacterized protein n=1 Tax=Mesorhizobium atlanticum TaxID=2233532 RepID=A0A330GW84_9HYPH|nr:hypothetical protein [Mesorhizobium atlanticum]RAZ78685.1 hypothetical protein DPM35_09100 [Mesorhizobium atlanticum]
MQLSLSLIRNTATSAEAAVILMLHPSLRAGLTNAQPQARAIITLSGMSLSDMPAAVCAAEMPSRPIPVAILRLQGGTGRGRWISAGTAIAWRRQFEFIGKERAAASVSAKQRTEKDFFWRTRSGCFFAGPRTR